MKRMLAVTTLLLVPFCAGLVFAQSGTQAPAAPVAGRSTLGVTVVEMETVVLGWSVKRELFGKTVVNDKNEKIGKVEDLIISPPKGGSSPTASYAILGVGGFLGIGERSVAIPVEQFKFQQKQLTLPGATKDALKGLPPFVYQKK